MSFGLGHLRGLARRLLSSLSGSSRDEGTSASTGAAAENRAAKLLRKRGYRILERNFACRVGEIDIVARDGATLVFVEVRHRSSDAFGEAAETVTPTKQKRITAAAHHYLARKPHNGDIRFDVVAFTAEEALVIVGAFEA